MKVFGLIFCGFASIFICIGIGTATSQHLKIVNSEPISARILSKEVERRVSRDSDGHTSVTYAPIVRFSYEIGGRKYENSDVFPLSSSASSTWAHGVISRFDVGETYPAFVPAKDPQEAFLLRHYSFFPYIFILFPMIFMAVGLGIALGAGASSKRPPQPVPASEGWLELKPKRSIAQRVRAAGINALGWFTVMGLACGHYYVSAAPDYEVTAHVFTGIFAALGFIPLGMLIYYLVLGTKTRDACVFIDQVEPRLGTSLTIGARQSFKQTLELEGVKLGVVCTAATRVRRGSKTTYSTETHYENLESLDSSMRASAGQTLEYALETELPRNRQPSSPPKHKGYPRYRWAIRLNIAIDDSPDYNMDFPIVVHPAGPEPESSSPPIGAPTMRV